MNRNRSLTRNNHVGDGVVEAEKAGTLLGEGDIRDTVCRVAHQRCIPFPQKPCTQQKEHILKERLRAVHLVNEDVAVARKKHQPSGAGAKMVEFYRTVLGFVPRRRRNLAYESTESPL